MEVREFDRTVSLLTIFGHNVRVTPGVLAVFTKALYDSNVNIYAISSGHESFTIIVDMKDEETTFGILKRIMNDEPVAFNEIIVRSNKGLICVDATNYAETPGIANAITKGLAEENINIIEMFSSYGSITIAIEIKDIEKAFKAIKKNLETKTIKIKED